MSGYPLKCKLEWSNEFGKYSFEIDAKEQDLDSVEGLTHFFELLASHIGFDCDHIEMIRK